jgi:hypothetical protein
MSNHDKHAHNKNHGHQPHSAKKKSIHHDWRFWTAVVLMLLAMAAYVMTNDLSEVPGGAKVPADAGDGE